MKKRLQEIIFGKNTILNGLIALLVVTLIALGCTCGKNLDLGNLGKNSNSSTTSPFGDDDSEMPDDALLNAMIKETTADFAAAVSTEDFSNIYNKASSDFQATYTEDQMKDAFKDFISKKRVILPILAKTISMEPSLSPAPHIRTEQGLSILVVEGQYTTKPVPMRFEYEYVKRGGQWKLLKLVIKLT